MKIDNSAGKMLRLNSHLLFGSNCCLKFKRCFQKKVLINGNIEQLSNDDDDENDENASNSQYYGNFRKLLKTQSDFDYKDGYTCLQVPCKLCCYRKSNKNIRLANDKTSAPSSTSTLWAYVNKRTGAFICPSCAVRVPLLLASKYYDNMGINNQDTTQISIKTEAESEFTMSLDKNGLTEPTNEIVDQLAIKGLRLADLELLNVAYDKIQQTLHFPLRNVIRNVVGEQKFDLVHKTTQTSPKRNCSGLLIYESVIPQNSSNSVVGCSKAILVSTIQDFLVLIGQRLEGCKCQWVCNSIPFNISNLIIIRII